MSKTIGIYQLNQRIEKDGPDCFEYGRPIYLRSEQVMVQIVNQVLIYGRPDDQTGQQQNEYDPRRKHRILRGDVSHTGLKNKRHFDNCNDCSMM